MGNALAADLITFWDQPRRGGNSFNRLPPDQVYFDALGGYGADWVRLAYDKWRPEQRDFLLGDADHYAGLAQDDLRTLKAALDRAHRAGLKVVIAPLSLPYMRWSQNNGGKFDGRLWQDRKHWPAAVAFWRDLAEELKAHPAVAAYNLVNEPAPEKQAGLVEHGKPAAMQAWYQAHRGGARDLPAFYQQVIDAIRSVDPATPVMVDAGWYGAADAFSYWPARLPDDKVLYSFHMYEPYAATSGPNLKRAKPYRYPGKVPFADGQPPEYWDGKRVAAYLQPVFDWARAKGVPPSRMVAGEFGCIRKLAGCKTYLEDVLAVLDREKTHWAFYSFREDSWDAMDYELGGSNVPWQYWEAMEKGLPDPVKRSATPQFEPIRKRLSRNIPAVPAP
ncbi:glycoside hydrolase family 5 protein [Chitinimonas arctica]|uniref:Glycoside hydrolase family 5 protein n=2 Tax=Chitinimonas arctica TaxID=2594795 RepID=A0A516SMP9_9NEIS|nr:glycoside hydrolase family 5 protein [Chitinimonas arctica]